MLDFLLKDPEERKKQQIVGRINEVLNRYKFDLQSSVDLLFANVREIQGVGWTRGNSINEIRMEITRNWERRRGEITSLVERIVMIIDRLDTELRHALQGR